MLPNPIALPIERRGAVEDVDRRLTPGRPARRRGFPPSPLVIEVGTVRRRPSSRVAEWRTRGVLRVEHIGSPADQFGFVSAQRDGVVAM